MSRRTTSRTSLSTSRPMLAAVLVSVTLLSAACGGGDDRTDATSGPASSSPTAAVTETTAATGATESGDDPAASAPSAPAAPASIPAPATTDAPADAPAVAGGEAFDICATIPTVADLQPFFDEPLVRTQDLERGPGFDVCEVASDGFSAVQFTRVADTTREVAIELATELGSPPVDVPGAAVPGTYFYSGVAAVVIDGTEWSVQAITMAVISDPNGADAMARSTTLLDTWLRMLGLA
jgi:hypothetical protein